MASLSWVVISSKLLQMSSPTGQGYARGALFGLAAVSIWSGWIVVARLGLRTSLTPWDITAIRFGVAGVIVLPYLIRKRSGC